MAIYVYQSSNGVLASSIPDDLTIAQAQAQGLLASNAVLTAKGLAAKDSLPPLDDTHTWDAATTTVITVPAPPTPHALSAIAGNTGMILLRKAAAAQAAGKTVDAQSYLLQAQVYLTQARTS